MRLLWKNNDITGYITSCTWSGSAKQAARSVVFNVAYSPNDKNAKVLNIQNGDKITFYPGYPDDKKYKFVGIVTTRERKSEAGELSYTAMDKMIHLLRSNGTYKFENKTPEKITKMVCNDLKITTGNIAKTKLNISKIFFQERPYYEIIMAVYTKVHRKNKKVYIAQMNADKLEVIEKGKIIPNFRIAQGESITDSSCSETIDNMVNRVYIYNSDNKKIGSISNSDWVKKYGVFQNAISVESGTGKKEAEAELQGIEKSASLTAIGDIRCVAGMGIIIKDSRTGLNGKFWIENDSHEFSNGMHMMSLQLAFKNIMDEQEEDEEQTKQAAQNGGVTVTTTGGASGSSDALNAVLNQARALLGLGENPPGSNHNIVTQTYGFDDAWCCMFIWYIFMKAGQSALFMGGAKEAYCFNVMYYYQKRGKWGSTPKVGALIIYGGSGHIGIVESVNGSSFVTIEGNYGNCVQRRQGPSGNILGFCYPDYPVTTTTSSDVGVGFTRYNMSDGELRAIARLCQQEQGDAVGAAAEASLMANRFEMFGQSYGSIYNYVKNCGWFAKAAYFMSLTGSLDGNIYNSVRDVLINGKRTLPNYVDEHDCFSDIASVSNNGSYFSKTNRAGYQRRVTVVRNNMGSTYTFYCFPTATSDPFGYTAEAARKRGV